MDEDSIHEGFITAQLSSQRWKVLWVILRPGMLRFFTYQWSENPKKTILLNSAVRLERAESFEGQKKSMKYALRLRTADEDMVLVFPSEGELETWSAHITSHAALSGPADTIEACTPADMDEEMDEDEDEDADTEGGSEGGGGDAEAPAGEADAAAQGADAPPGALKGATVAAPVAAAATAGTDSAAKEPLPAPASPVRAGVHSTVEEKSLVGERGSVRRLAERFASASASAASSSPGTSPRARPKGAQESAAHGRLKGSGDEAGKTAHAVDAVAAAAALVGGDGSAEARAQEEGATAVSGEVAAAENDDAARNAAVDSGTAELVSEIVKGRTSIAIGKAASTTRAGRRADRSVSSMLPEGARWSAAGEDADALSMSDEGLVERKYSSPVPYSADCFVSKQHKQRSRPKSSYLEDSHLEATSGGGRDAKKKLTRACSSPALVRAKVARASAEAAKPDAGYRARHTDAASDTWSDEEGEAAQQRLVSDADEAQERLAEARKLRPVLSDRLIQTRSGSSTAVDESVDASETQSDQTPMAVAVTRLERTLSANASEDTAGSEYAETAQEEDEDSIMSDAGGVARLASADQSVSTPRSKKKRKKKRKKREKEEKRRRKQKREEEEAAAAAAAAAVRPPRRFKLLVSSRRQIKRSKMEVRREDDLTIVINPICLTRPLPPLEVTDDAVTLDLSREDLEQVPPNVLRESTVTVLNLYLNMLRTIPSRIWMLSNLRQLGLNENVIESLPPEIGQLSQLEILDLRYNKLERLPEELSSLPKLKRLFLRYNRLVCLPERLGDVTSLELLSVRNNQLERLPDSISSLTNLRVLDAFQNNISTLPSVRGLDSLVALNVQNNCLGCLPDDIHTLPSLRKLHIGNNPLGGFSVALCALSKLTLLDAEGCELEALPAEFGNLKALEQCYLARNRLTALPESMGSLRALNQLVLAGNRISQLPESMCELSGLKELDLSTNQFSELPPAVVKMSGLSTLKVQDNNISSVACLDGSPSSVRILDIGENQLEELPPAFFSTFQRLKTLRLTCNSLASIPEEIKQLSSLKELYLDQNCFEELPMSVCALKNIAVLSLMDNELRDIPNEILQLSNLSQLKVDGNPFSDIPGEVTGGAAVFQYIVERVAVNTVELE